ncbi:MAG TPA: hypothetical protein VMV49_16795 [Candidatus Deferrimicrobium sp.]|nr:hypothetical protein [Candidatus Deferrimicrobium sp.]
MKRTQEFYLEDISPQKVYETLLNILKESVIPPSMKPRRLRLKTYSILSENPFNAEVEAQHGATGFSWGESVNCYIYTRTGKTFLTITSKGDRLTLSDGPQHRKNILGLYNDLNFRLKTEKSPQLDQILSPNEKKVVRFYPIKYEGIKLDCIITDSRLHLCRNQLVRSTINLRDISSTSIAKEREYKGVGYFFLAFIFLGISNPFLILLGVLWSQTDLEFKTALISIFLPLFLIGISFVIVGVIKQYNHFLQIESLEGSFKLFAEKNIIIQLKSMVKMITAGKFPTEEKVIPTTQTKKEKSKDSESQKYSTYLRSQKYYNDLQKINQLYEEAKEAITQGNLKIAIKKLSKVIQGGINFLDANLVYQALEERAFIEKKYRAERVERNPKLLDLKERMSTDLRYKVAIESLTNRILYDIRKRATLIGQKAEEKMRNGKYKSAATLFLKSSMDWHAIGELEKSKELLEKLKLAKSYL